MDTDSDKDSGINWKWLGIVAGLVVLGAIVAYVLVPRLSLDTNADLIIVKAVDGPIKVKPLDPGGKTIEHQELLVIDMLKNGVSDAGNVETLRPSSANPEPPPINMADSAAANSVASKAADETATLLAAPETPVTKAETPAEAPAETAPKPTAPATPTKPKRKTVAVDANTPLFVIQLAAFRNEAKASEVANLLSEKHTSRLDDIRLETMRLDTGANGVFFRVVSAPLTRPVAEEACDRLRRAGQDCFLRKFVSPSD